jgi:hypothetical protein
MFETHMKDRHSQNYYCRHCQVEFSDQTGLTDHINATHVTWSTTTWEAPDDDLSEGKVPDDDLPEGEVPDDDLSEDSDDFRNEAGLRSEADDHGSAPCTEAVTCKQCRDSKHFSRRCEECRPISKNRCYTCGSTKHKKRGALSDPPLEGATNTWPGDWGTRKASCWHN